MPTVCSNNLRRALGPLFNALDKVKIRQSSNIAVNVRLPIGRQLNTSDRIDARGVGGNQLLPRFALPSRDIDLEHPGRNLAETVNVDRFAVQRPASQNFSLQSRTVEKQGSTVP